jgi:hypothetical protein
MARYAIANAPYLWNYLILNPKWPQLGDAEHVAGAAPLNSQRG